MRVNGSTTVNPVVSEASHTIVLVTHDLEQARRVAGRVACVCRRDGAGEVIETACCGDLFDNPQCRETMDYLDAPGGDLAARGDDG